MLKEKSQHKFFFISFVLIILISLFFLFPSFSLSLDDDDWISISACRTANQVCGFFKPYGLQVWFYGKLYDFWGFNFPLFYILAFLFRSLAAFSILMFVFHLTKNKVAAFLSGFLFAVTFSGIQTTFEPTNMIVYPAIMGTMFFLYFFFATREKLTKTNFIFLNTSLFVTTLLSPVRMTPLYFWQFIIDILWFVVSPTIIKFKNLIIRQTGIVTIFIFLSRMGTFKFNETDAFTKAAFSSFDQILRRLESGDISIIPNFLTGLGNVIFPSQNNFIIKIFGQNLNLILGGLYILFLITIFVLVLKKKRENLLMFFNFLIWPPIFYLSFWLVSLTSNTEIVIQSFRRYMLPLFVAVSINLGLVLAFTANNKFRKWHNILISLTIFLLLAHSFTLLGFLKKLSIYRNGPYVKQFWQQLKTEVPNISTEGGKADIFYFEYDEHTEQNVPFNKFEYAVNDSFSRIAAIIYNIPQNSEKPANPVVTDSFEELVSYVRDGSPLIKNGFKVAPVSWDRIFAFRLEEERMINIKDTVKKRVEAILNQFP